LVWYLCSKFPVFAKMYGFSVYVLFFIRPRRAFTSVSTVLFQFCFGLGDTRLSRRWVWSMPSSGIRRREVWVSHHEDGSNMFLRYVRKHPPHYKMPQPGKHWFKTSFGFQCQQETWFRLSGLKFPCQICELFGLKHTSTPLSESQKWQPVWKKQCTQFLSIFSFPQTSFRPVFKNSIYVYVEQTAYRQKPGHTSWFTGLSPVVLFSGLYCFYQRNATLNFYLSGTP
jgi:hypothetical protein